MYFARNGDFTSFGPIALLIPKIFEFMLFHVETYLNLYAVKPAIKIAMYLNRVSLKININKYTMGWTIK